MTRQSQRAVCTESSSARLEDLAVFLSLARRRLGVNFDIARTQTHKSGNEANRAQIQKSRQWYVRVPRSQADGRLQWMKAEEESCVQSADLSIKGLDTEMVRVDFSLAFL